ncbi:hypothetical protein EVAR_89498_1 [Eumeta japonica]|uniref:Uncharacterized protein n=1 Tax=Eumeta variegata TaxID=151549 RepID=A0A4C1XJD2_EUMVA|nr:hypothetical protein EVAR_89498_1 [Eumeta japonica]
MISTFHDSSTHGNKGWRGMKPICVKRLQYDYGGIDLKSKALYVSNGKKERFSISDCSIVEDGTCLAVRSLISRSELRLDRTKTICLFVGYFVLPDVFTKICHKKSDGNPVFCMQSRIMRLEKRLFPLYHSVETLPPRRLKTDKPKRGHGWVDKIDEMN